MSFSPTKQLDELIAAQNFEALEEWLEKKNSQELYKYYAEWLESNQSETEKIRK